MRSVAVAVISMSLLGAQTTHTQTVEAEASAPAVEGFALSDQSLAVESFRAGTTSLDVYAGRGVDIRSLLRAAKVAKDDTAQTVRDKVDAVRQRLYPNDPIVLSVTSGEKPGVAGAYLVKGIAGWNYRGGYWAIYASTTAVLFVDDLLGAYNVYDCYPCGSWRLRGTYRTGAGATRYNYGSYAYRGFKLVNGSGSRTDFVMYFFH